MGAIYIPQSIFDFPEIPSEATATNGYLNKFNTATGNFYWAADSTGGGGGSTYGDDFVNIMTDYGAVGDGVTDDTTAIQNALTASTKVYIPKPSVGYLVSSTLYPQNYSTIFGSSIRSPASTAHILFSGSGTCIHMPEPGYCWINGIRIVKSGAAGTSIGINFSGTSVAVNGCLIKDVVVTGFDRPFSFTNKCNYCWLDNVSGFAGSTGTNGNGLYISLAAPYTFGHIYNSGFSAKSISGTAILIDSCDTGSMKLIHVGQKVHLRANTGPISNLRLIDFQQENGTATNLLAIGDGTYGCTNISCIGFELQVPGGIGEYVYFGTNASLCSLSSSTMVGSYGIKDDGVSNIFVGNQLGTAGLCTFNGTKTVVQGNIFNNASTAVTFGSTFTGAVTGNSFAKAPSIHATAGSAAQFSGNFWSGVDATSVASTPNFKGQWAYVGSNIYKSKGTSSSADWILLG